MSGINLHNGIHIMRTEQFSVARNEYVLADELAPIAGERKALMARADVEAANWGTSALMWVEDFRGDWVSSSWNHYGVSVRFRIQWCDVAM